MTGNLSKGISIKRKYQKKKQAGLCSKCDNKAEPNKTLCKTCANKAKIRYIKNKKTRSDVMNKEQKKQEILKLAQKQNGITITDVRKLLKITWNTARIYLYELQLENKLISEQKSHQYLFYIKNQT